MNIINTIRFEIQTLITKYEEELSSCEAALNECSCSAAHDMLGTKVCVLNGVLEDLSGLRACVEATKLGLDTRVGLYDKENGDALVMCLRTRHWVSDTDIWEYLSHNSPYTRDNAFIVRNIPIEEYMSFMTETK